MPKSAYEIDQQDNKIERYVVEITYLKYNIYQKIYLINQLSSLEFLLAISLLFLLVNLLNAQINATEGIALCLAYLP